MKVINLRNQNNITYPLSRKIFENDQVVYHGTSSNFTERIEKSGWRINDPVYDMNDAKKVCDIFDSIGYYNSSDYVDLRSFTLGVGNHHYRNKCPSFSQDYWIARDYANNPGGETLKALLIAIDDFLKFCKDNLLKDDHIEKLKRKIQVANENLIKSKSLKQPLTEADNNFITNYQNMKFSSEKALEILNNSEILENYIKKMHNIKQKYLPFIQNHYGVVYVVQVEPQWFKNWIELYLLSNEKHNLLIKSGVNLFAKVDVPAENIIAKINFPNGITMFRPDSFYLPLPWDLKVFIDWLSQHQYFINKSFLKEYLNQ